MERVEEVVDYYVNGKSPHKLHRVYDYIEEPKRSGYRGSHLIFKFHGEGDASIYNRQFVEVQVRTELQHAWATAVEAVGLVRREHLKGGEGDARWLRFFQLVAADMASSEGRPLVPGVSDDPAVRREELKSIDSELSAIKSLESFNEAIQFADEHFTKHARYYIIQYNWDTKVVSVRPSGHVQRGTDAYDVDTNSSDVVLVEIDDVKQLREAYPNYYLDVSIFNQKARLAMYGDKGVGQSLDLAFLANNGWRLGRRR